MLFLAILNCIFCYIPNQWVVGVFDLPNDSGNSGWKVNGTRLFVSFRWKISGSNGTSEKVVLLFRWKLFRWKFVFHL